MSQTSLETWQFHLAQVSKLNNKGQQGSGPKIFLTRHGESQFNRSGQLGGDSSLSDMGQIYSQILPRVVLEQLEDASEEEESTTPMAIYTSMLQRTIQTASNFPSLYPQTRLEGLNEINAGIFEEWTYQQIEAEYPNEFIERKKDKLGYRYPKGESYLDIVDRLKPIFELIIQQKQHICIVAHQAIHRVIYGFLTQQPLEKVPGLSIPLHTVIELTPQPDGTITEKRFPVDVAVQNPYMSMGNGKESTLERNATEGEQGVKE